MATPSDNIDTQNPPPQIINTLSPSAKERPLIYKLLTQNKATILFKAGKVFKLDYQKGHQKWQKIICLSHSILSHSLIQNENIHYLLIDKKIGSGSFGVTYTISQEISAENRNHFYLAPPKIVKIQSLKSKTRGAFIRAASESEAMITKKIPHLQSLPLLYEKDINFLIMNYVGTYDLLILLEAMEKKPNDYSINTRLQLIKALLIAYQKQVQDQSLIHCDIKPENIRFTATHDALEIYIIDYGLSLYNLDNVIQCMPKGSAGYCAKEQILKQPIQASADIFSLGRVLMHILDACPKAFIDYYDSNFHNHLLGLVNDEQKAYFVIKYPSLWDPTVETNPRQAWAFVLENNALAAPQLFINLEKEVSAPLRVATTHLIEKMTALDESKRPKLNEVIAEVDSLIKYLHQQQRQVDLNNANTFLSHHPQNEEQHTPIKKQRIGEMPTL